MPKCPDCGEVFAELGEPITVTQEQRQTIDRAIAYIREDEKDDMISEGYALELIAADYLAGQKTETMEPE